MRAYTQTPGLITDEVGIALAKLAAGVKPGLAIVEVGSYHGKSTCYLAGNAPSECPVYAVDPWELVDVKAWCGWCEQPRRAEFERNLAAVDLLWRVKVRQGRSVDVARSYDGPQIGLLFVDGNHSAEALRADLAAWRPHLHPTAFVAVDDYGGSFNPDVAPVIDGLIEAGELQWYELAYNRLAVVEEP